MNVFYLVRTVSGLFDVPLDDPKQRFSQKMRITKSEVPAKGPKKAFRASSVPVDFKEDAMVDGCMRAPRALHRPTVRPHAHPRATMRTAAACSSFA